MKYQVYNQVNNRTAGQAGSLRECIRTLMDMFGNAVTLTDVMQTEWRIRRA